MTGSSGITLDLLGDSDLPELRSLFAGLNLHMPEENVEQFICAFTLICGRAIKIELQHSAARQSAFPDSLLRGRSILGHGLREVLEEGGFPVSRIAEENNQINLSLAHLARLVDDLRLVCGRVIG